MGQTFGPCEVHQSKPKENQQNTKENNQTSLNKTSLRKAMKTNIPGGPLVQKQKNTMTFYKMEAKTKKHIMTFSKMEAKTKKTQ